MLLSFLTKIYHFESFNLQLKNYNTLLKILVTNGLSFKYKHK